MNFHISTFKPLLLLCLALILSACGGSDSNKAPSITLKGEYVVTEYSDITIAAEAVDTDGEITNYQWQQTSGLNVELLEIASSTLYFTAPNVSEEQQLTFELTVTDNNNASTTKEVVVRLQFLIGDIEDIVFTDDEFKRCVFDNALAHNWHLATEFTELACTTRGANIETTDELSAFVNLTYLYLAGYSLKDIDLSAQTRLTDLSLPSSQLTAIDLNAQTQLTNLDLSWNKLTQIDLSAQTQLTNLDLLFNELTYIDLSAQKQLTNLALGFNELVDIDLSAQTKLTNLDLFSNQLTSINLIEQTQLTDLSLSHNKCDHLTMFFKIPYALCNRIGIKCFF